METRPPISHTAEAPDPLDIVKDQNRLGKGIQSISRQVLIEGLYHGVLEDRSDEIHDSPYGHRILMRLPLDDASWCFVCGCLKSTRSRHMLEQILAGFTER